MALLTKIISVLLIILLLAGIALSIAYTATANGKIVVEVQYDKVCQEMDGWGCSAGWWAQIAGAEGNEAAADGIMNALYSKDGLELNIFRYPIGGGESENAETRVANPWRRGESFYYYNNETQRYEYDFSRDGANQRILKKALSLGCVDTVVLFSGSPHYSMTKNGHASGSFEEGKSNHAPEKYQEYAEYFLNITEYFLSQNVPVKFISPINEPQWAWSGGWVGQEGCHYEPQEVADLLGAFAREIIKRGINVKISGPESGCIDDCERYYNLIAKDELLMSVMGSFSYHSYWADNNAKLKTQFGQWARKNLKLRLDMSEWCELPCLHSIDDAYSAVLTARIIAQDVGLSSANSWMSWVGVNQIAIGTDGKSYSDGLLAANADCSEWQIAKRYYGLAHFSKFVPVGSKRVGVKQWNFADALRKYSKDVYSTAFITLENKTVIVLTNEGKERFVRLKIKQSKISLYQTDSQKSLEKTYSGDVPEKILLPECGILTIVCE